MAYKGTVSDFHGNLKYKSTGYTIDDLQEMKQWDTEYSSWGSWKGDSGYSPPWVVTVNPDPPKPRDDQCPHCLRPWHPGSLTQRVVDMLANHSFDPKYRPEDDNSPIMCVGAEFEGPPRPKEYTWKEYTWSATYSSDTSSVANWASALIYDMLGTLSIFYTNPTYDVNVTNPAIHKAGELVEFGKYPVEKDPNIDEHVHLIQEVIDKFDQVIELPNIKADYDSLADRINKEFQCGPVSSFVKA